MGGYDTKEPSYEGEVDETGLSHGKGKMTFLDGSTYEGDFVHGLSDGFGILKSPNGESYEGNW